MSATDTVTGSLFPSGKYADSIFLAEFDRHSLARESNPDVLMALSQGDPAIQGVGLANGGFLFNSKRWR